MFSCPSLCSQTVVDFLLLGILKLCFNQLPIRVTEVSGLEPLKQGV